VDSKADWSA